MSNIHLITFQMDIRYSSATQLSNHFQMDIPYSFIKRPSNDIPDGYSQMDIRYSNIKHPSENLPDGYLPDGYSIFECQISI